jgi:hypothetical protein
LFDIPEAREYMRRLWSEAKPLLRILSESTTAPRPDDLNGLPPELLSLAGMGWLDVYMIGHHELGQDTKVLKEQFKGVISVEDMNKIEVEATVLSKL